MKYFIYEAILEGRKRFFLTLLNPDVVLEKGLRNQVILGEIKGTDRIDRQEFTPNAAFLELFHRTVAKTMLRESGCVEKANKKGSGWIFLVDGRVKDRQNRSDSKDIIGSYKVEAGKMVEGSYNANPNYCVISEDGFFKLPRRLKNALMNELLHQLG